jgi:hypothetical protein
MQPRPSITAWARIARSRQTEPPTSGSGRSWAAPWNVKNIVLSDIAYIKPLLLASYPKTQEWKTMNCCNKTTPSQINESTFSIGKWILQLPSRNKTNLYMFNKSLFMTRKTRGYLGFFIEKQKI